MIIWGKNNGELRLQVVQILHIKIVRCLKNVTSKYFVKEKN